MAAGTLQEEKLARYIAQDEVYVAEYGRIFYQLADLAWDTRTADMIRAYALSGTDSEQQLHQLLIDRFGIESTAEPFAVTIAYNAHEKKALETGQYEYDFWDYGYYGE